MKTIELTQGKVAIVDDDDFGWLSQLNWYSHKNHTVFYASRKIQLPNGKQSTLSMHRAILERHGHKIDDLEVDHRNHDGLDNRKENLRAGTVAENQGNRTCHDDNFVGVYLHGVRWQASVSVNHKRFNVGTFDTAHEAALARDQYIIDHGLTGYPLNFPEVFNALC